MSNVAENPASGSGPRNRSGTPTWWIVTPVLPPNPAKVIGVVIPVSGSVNTSSPGEETGRRAERGRRWHELRNCTGLPLLGSALETLLDVVIGLADALGANACECGRPEMRRWPPQGLRWCGEDALGRLPGGERARSGRWTRNPTGTGGPSLRR